MAQEAVPRILIVYLHFKRRDQLPDRPDDIVCLLILNKTGIHRKNKMGPLLVYAGNDPPLPVPGHDRMDLISVMPGVLHSDHVTDLAEHRKNKMGPLLVYAGNDPPLPVPGHDRMDLISVMPGVLHSDHVTDLAEWL